MQILKAHFQHLQLWQKLTDSILISKNKSDNGKERFLNFLLQRHYQLIGHSATHAIVFAQLYVHGILQGIHAFCMQIRDIDTMKPLNGS